MGWTKFDNNTLERIMKDDRLSAADIRVFLYLLRIEKGWNIEGGVNAKVKDISAAIGISERSAIRSLARLMEEGYVCREKLGKSYIYTIETDGTPDSHVTCGESIHDSPVTDIHDRPVTNIHDESVTRPFLYINKRERNIKDTIVSGRVRELFESFWSEYPKKQNRRRAFAQWTKLSPDEEQADIIMNALRRQRNNPQWQKESGRYIPSAENYLRDRRFEDEPVSLEFGSDGGYTMSFDYAELDEFDFTNEGCDDYLLADITFGR